MRPKECFFELQNIFKIYPVSALPAGVDIYVKRQYKSSINEASKKTKANGEINYEAEVNKQALVFDKEGKFIKVEKD
jgi:hypothetical protein